MKIKLSKHYRNASRHLKPGEYTDDEIGSLAQYLVNNGHAELIEDNPPQPEPEADDETTFDYFDATLTDLRDMLPDGVTEEDIVSDPDAHWTIRRDELAEWLTGQ